jgi:hypothetical protein
MLAAEMTPGVVIGVKRRRLIRTKARMELLMTLWHRPGPRAPIATIATELSALPGHRVTPNAVSQWAHDLGLQRRASVRS